MPAYKKRFSQILKDIRSLKIQGATNVARAGVQALELVAQSGAGKRELQQAAATITKTRPTEPAMRNMLKYLLTVDKGTFKQRAGIARKYFTYANDEIAYYGASKIKKNSTVYTHCHSSAVVGVLKAAKTKKIRACNTETRPLFQGRSTAKDLAKARIPVEHFVDSGMYHAISQSDIVLLGADAITPRGVYNKIGSAMAAQLAAVQKKPLYICSNALKFDPRTLKGKKVVVEERASSEVWKAPKGVTVRNAAFDCIPTKHITGIISELGVLSPQKFVSVVKKKYPWMM